MNTPHHTIISRVAQRTQQEMNGLCTAHDLYHITRVVTVAHHLHRLEEKGDQLVIEVGAWLHEALDTKFFSADLLEVRKEELRAFLRSLHLDEERIAKIMQIIEHIGYGKSLARPADFPYTDEFKIVEDADRLDAIGAIAIARVFTYGGQQGRPMYDPHLPATELLTPEVYTAAKATSTSYNHFAEKLLRLKDLMHTPTGKRIATQRDAFMRKFLAEFEREWSSDLRRDLYEL